MNLPTARKTLRKDGCAHATGEALKAMYADLLATLHGGKAENYYKVLQPFNRDAEIDLHGRAMAKDRQTAWDALIGLYP